MTKSMILAITVSCLYSGFVLAQSPTESPKQPPLRALDEKLFDDLRPGLSQRTPSDRTKGGEDLGQPSESRSPVVEIGRQMRNVEARLRAQDTSPRTRQLQSQITDNLAQLIDQLEQRENAAKQQRASQTE